jgi:hypothetical protein
MTRSDSIIKESLEKQQFLNEVWAAQFVVIAVAKLRQDGLPLGEAIDLLKDHDQEAASYALLNLLTRKIFYLDSDQVLWLIKEKQ